jgi:hypothetical protein
VNTGAAAVFCISQNDTEKNIYVLTSVKDATGASIMARASEGGYIFDYQSANAGTPHDGVIFKVKVLG